MNLMGTHPITISTNNKLVGDLTARAGLEQESSNGNLLKLGLKLTSLSSMRRAVAMEHGILATPIMSELAANPIFPELGKGGGLHVLISGGRKEERGSTMLWWTVGGTTSFVASRHSEKGLLGEESSSRRSKADGGGVTIKIRVL